MKFELIYKVAGETRLANCPNESSCDTEIAHITLRRTSPEKPFRLAVTPKGEALPHAQHQSNRFASNVASQIQQTEGWIGVLEMAAIYLWGTTAGIRCSIEMDDALLQAGDADEIIHTAHVCISAALNNFIGVTLPLPELA